VRFVFIGDRWVNTAHIVVVAPNQGRSLVTLSTGTTLNDPRPTSKLVAEILESE
jgi:hypothetical protein